MRGSGIPVARRFVAFGVEARDGRGWMQVLGCEFSGKVL